MLPGENAQGDKGSSLRVSENYNNLGEGEWGKIPKRNIQKRRRQTRRVKGVSQTPSGENKEEELSTPPAATERRVR